MNEEKITVKAVCNECDGTGIFIGAYCHYGAGMVCRNCGGKGYKLISYTPFTSRKRREDVTRVFQPVSFQHLYPSVHKINDYAVDFSQFGCSYEEWENGAEPIPVP